MISGSYPGDSELVKMWGNLESVGTHRHDAPMC